MARVGNLPPDDSSCFGVFDPEAEVDISERMLPHWFQPGVTTFITLRTVDSLPREVISLWERQQQEWLHHRGIYSPGIDELLTSGQLSMSLRRQFQRYRNQTFHGHLDDCHGECLLRRPELAQIVGDALRYFDGDRYDLDSFIVMPNHAHLLVQFRLPTELRKQCTSWMRYTARQLNRALNRCGRFWQSEPFDHLVRSAEQFDYLHRYIGDNPRRAGLRSGEYLYWKQ